MKRYTYYIRAVLPLLILLPLMASCRKELCYNHYRTLSVGLLYEHEWERDYGMQHLLNWDSGFHGMEYDELRPVKPEWVMLVRFASDGSSTEKYMKVDGGDVIIPEDEGQSMMLYNGDTEYIVLSDLASASNARASATGRSRASLTVISENHPNARTTNPPDILYSAYVKNPPHVELHETKSMPVKMQPLVYTYVIRYEFEEGLEYVALARGALGGMAESVYLSDGRTSDNTSIILFDCETTSYGCMAKVRSFGVPGFPDEYYGQEARPMSTDKKYTLNLEVMLTNGDIESFDIDISDQMAKQPRGGVITVKGFKVKVPISSGHDSGFSVDVSGWGNHQDVDLPVGC